MQTHVHKKFWCQLLETNNIPKGTLQITITNATQYLVMGLFYIIVTKTNALTEADIGALSILTFLSTTFILITDLALSTALTKFASENLGKNQPQEAASVVRTITKTVVALSLAGYITAVLLSQQLSRYLFGTTAYASLIILILIHAFLFSIITLCKSTLQALYLFGKIAITTVIFIGISRAIGATLALLHMGLNGVVVGYLAGSIISLAVALIFVRGRLPKPTHNTPLKPILIFSLPLFISNLTLLVLNWADIVIVSFITLDYSLTGIYYLVINSISVLSILWIPITTTIFPALSARYGLKKPEHVTEIIKTSSRYLIYIILPSCIGLATISSTALTFFYGPVYTIGALAFSILSVATIIIAFYSLLTTALTAIGKTNQILKINVISAVSAVITLLALVPFLQIIGAALARLATQMISLTLAIYVLRKHVKVKLDKESLWKSAVASMPTIPFLIILESPLTTKTSTTQTLTIEILVATSIYLLGLYALRALKSQDFELLRQSFPKSISKYINIIEKVIVR